MSMDHYYDFFDRECVDHLWSMSWRDFQREYRTRWATSTKYEFGEYMERSLRECICFYLGAEPTAGQLEDILARRTIRWTIQHSTSQFGILGEIMRHVPKCRSSYAKAIEIPGGDVSVLFSAAVNGYVNRKLAAATLQAVLKLHSCADPGQWVRLSRTARKEAIALGKCVDLLQPIYSWQGPSAIADEEWANCLRTTATRRFILFITRAWDDNWPVVGLTEAPSGILRQVKEPRFRDFLISRELRKAAEKAATFKRPTVYRQWF